MESAHVPRLSIYPVAPRSLPAEQPHRHAADDPLPCQSARRCRQCLDGRLLCPTSQCRPHHRRRHPNFTLQRFWLCLKPGRSIQFFIEKVAPFLVQSIPKTRSGAQKTDGALWLLITQGQSGSKLAPSVFWVSVGKALLKVSIFALTHVLLLLPVRRHYCVAIVRHFPF